MRRRFAERHTIGALFLLVLLQVGAVALGKPSTDESTSVAETAFGYATVYNIGKVEELVSRRLKSEELDTTERARLLWVRAFAYVNFMTEYRTDRYEKPYVEDLAGLADLDQGLLADEIASRHASYRFYVPETTSPAELENRLDDLLTEAQDLTNPAARAAWTAHANNTLAVMIAKDSPTSASRYREEALKNFRRAAAARPDSYSCVLWLADTLTVLKRAEETTRVAEAMARIFHEKTTFYADDSPAFKAGTFEALLADERKLPAKYEEKYGETVGYKVDSLIQELVDLTQPGVVPQEKTLAGFAAAAREWEEGKLPAFRLKALARLYYRLAHAYNMAGQIDKALETYKRLERISPHYAELHLNKAVLLAMLADGEAVPPLKRTKLEAAIDECRQQRDFNWHGDAAARARKLSQVLQKRLEKIR